MHSPMAAAAAPPASRAQRLPELRKELILLPGAAGSNGAPTWLLNDPVRHRFFSIDEVTCELLSLMPGAQTSRDLAWAAAVKFNRQLSTAAIERFLRFVEDNQLCLAPTRGDWRSLHRSASKAGSFSWQRLAGTALSFRVSLFHPQRFLRATLPAVRFFFSHAFLITTLLVGTIGLYLVSRQWDQFIGSVPDSLDWSWAAAFAAALVIMKLLHELGHAYTAVQLGCHVSSMGVVFMMLAPMPYTDISDSWRLVDRRKRLVIDSAGVVVELAVAAYATLLWAFLPDGSLRSIAFVLATTGWITSLAINLNPLMRFDGYFILSEIIKVENLQARAFAIGRWQLRQHLFGLGVPAPEPLARGMLRWLAAYACAVCIWRLSLAFSIAAVLYHVAFKLAGIVLFCASIALLIFRPVWYELREWISMRTAIASRRRTFTTVAVFVAVVLGCIVPWSSTVVVPAIVEMSDQRPLHAPRPSLITAVAVAAGTEVRTGQHLAQLQSPELSMQLRSAQTRLALVESRILRSTADPSDRSSSAILDAERATLQASIAGIRAAETDLIVQAPMDGVVLEVDPAIQPGRFIGTAEPLMLIGLGGQLSAKGYVSIDNVARIAVGTTGVFIADDPRRLPWPVTVERIGAGGTHAIEIAVLASIFDGPVPVTHDSKGRLVPVEARAHVVMRVDPVGTAPRTVIRGTVHLKGASRSLVAQAWRRVMRVLMQESGA